MAIAAQTPAGTRAGPASAPPIYVLVAIALAGCLLAVFSITLAIRAGVPDIQIALLEWISLPYIAAGLVAWWRRPESRLGVLMVLGGFATGMLALQFTEIEALITLGAALDVVPVALFLHVFLAFPSGRLRSDFERILVAAAYAVAIGLQLAKMTLGAFGPDNLPAIASHPDGAQIVERVRLLSMSASCPRR